MRGHYQSGVRKLNRHYQSGGGVGYKTYTYTSMLASLLGFEFNVQTENYGWNQSGNYYTPSSDNIQTAPLYKISSGLPTSKTEENGYVVYDNWIATSSQSDYGTYRSSNSASRGSYPIWKYGEFRGDPYWAYKNDSMGWAQLVNNNLNQDNIPLSSTQYENYWYNGFGGNYRFEDVYSGMTLKVIIPIVEIIAIPLISNNYSEIMLTDEELPISFEGKIKLRYSGSRPSRVAKGANIHSWDEGGVMSIVDDASGFYMNCGYGEQTSAQQLGAFKRPVDQLYFICKDANGSRKVAGTSGTYTMVYAMRLVRLEVEDVVAAGKTIIL